MATPNRPLIIGDPSGPSPPYPLRMSGLVISGFGRGSKELGIPTANLPVDDTVTPWISSVPSGVYFGWASLKLPASHPDFVPTPAVTASPGSEPSQEATTISPDQQQQDQQQLQEHQRQQQQPLTRGANGFTVYPMVMSIGYNPFYRNTVRSAEVHILHPFRADFYGAELRLLVAGFVREERDYASLAALVADIRLDCAVAARSLARDGWAPRGVDVEVDIPPVHTASPASPAAADDGGPRGVGGGEGEGKGEWKVGEEQKTQKVVLRGRLEAGWLIEPSERQAEAGPKEEKK